MQKKQPAAGNRKGARAGQAKSGRTSGRPFKKDQPRTGRPAPRREQDDRPQTGRPGVRKGPDTRTGAGRPAGRPVKEERSGTNRPAGRPYQEDRPRSGNPTGRPFKKDQPRTGRPATRTEQDDRPRTGRPGVRKGPDVRIGAGRPAGRTQKPYPRKKAGTTTYRKSDATYDESIRLNRYVANAGVCSRREADVLIAAGAISVNGTVVTEMGTKVMPGDVVKYGDRRLNNEKKVYLLLNKPKDFITTTDDPQERKTVFDLIRSACKERIYPVGRLDRNTTGVLLFTNDGELTKKLTHPKHGVKKLYHVHIDKALTKADMLDIMKGIQLDGTLVVPDKLEFAGTANNKKEIGIEIHSGQNRVVRRLFEHFGYRVEKLDRVVFAGLTKKDLPRGKWRFLSEKEVNFLKMLG